MEAESLLLGGMAALTTAVVFLFGLVLKGNASTEKRLAACEEDRNNLWAALHRMEGAACDDGVCAVRKALALGPVRPLPPAT